LIQAPPELDQKLAMLVAPLLSAWLAVATLSGKLIGLVFAKTVNFSLNIVRYLLKHTVSKPLERHSSTPRKCCMYSFEGMKRDIEHLLNGQEPLPKCSLQELSELVLMPDTPSTRLTPVSQPGSPHSLKKQGHDAHNAASTSLHCDSNFIICRASGHVFEILKYTPAELFGKSILELMSPAVADVHQQIFRHLKHGSPDSVCVVGKQLLMSTMSRCREFVVLDADKEPVICSLSVILRKDLSSKVVMQAVKGKILNTVPHGFGKHINERPGMHVRDFDDVTCVRMDVAGSTRFSRSRPPSVMAELFHRMYVIANAVLLQEAFPFAYIHEIVGDSLLILVNASFMVRYPSRAATIGFHLATQVQRRLDVMLAAYSPQMYTRVGIAVGPVAAGVVDGQTFRVFGSTVYLSQRLESLCPRAKVACSVDFLDTLCKQIKGTVTVEVLESETEDFGTMRYATLQCSMLGALRLGDLAS